MIEVSSPLVGRGEYILRFTAIDDDGMSASCTTQVLGLPSPPDVTCPATIDTAPLSEATVTATAVDDGRIVTWRWRRASRPPGSAAGDPTPTDAATTQIRTDLAGEYVLEVTATDDDGMLDTCTTTVRAIASEGLRIEVSWNTDGTDMDTHLLSPIATRWFAEDDCYYGNCQGGGLEWFAPGRSLEMGAYLARGCMGCHGEHVGAMAELRPALDRAIASGLPAVVHVDIDPELNANAIGYEQFQYSRTL